MLGLKWHKIDSTTLCKGRELKNAKLAQALLLKQEFSKEEFAAFELHDVCFNDHVKVGSDCFQPTLMSEETRLKRKELRMRPCMIALAKKYELIEDTNEN